jgi:hypothetical protein
MTPDDLLARYADRPGDLTAEQRRQAEALLAGDADHAIIARVAALPAVGTEPAWDDLARSIRLACTDPPVPAWRRWLAWTPAVGALAAAAVLGALWLGRGEPLGPSVAIAPAAPAVVDPLADLERLAGELADDPDADDADLEGELAIEAGLDDGLDEELAADVGTLDWVEQLDDAELDDLALWLDEQEAG